MCAQDAPLLEVVTGANGLGLTDAQIAQRHASDPRCKKTPYYDR